MALVLEGLGVVLLALAGLVALFLGIAVVRLQRLRWQPVACRAVARETIPPGVRHTLDLGGQPLAAWGFAYSYSGTTNRALVSAHDEPLFFDVYQHTDGHTHAMVTPSAEPEAHQPCTLQLMTCLTNGNNWVTLNGYRHMTPLEVPRWRVFDDYLPTWDLAWARHLERVQVAQARICTDGLEVRRRVARAFEKLIPALVHQGRLVASDGGPHYRLRVSAAWRMAWDLLLGQLRTAWARRGQNHAHTTADLPGAAATPPTPAQGVDADLQAFETQRTLLRNTAPTSARRKWLVFLVTGLLFLLVGGWWMSWSLVPIVLAVVALHEGGHYLAMKLTGYRNLSVFFLPGLGGLAVGEKIDATPMEKLLVYLAGPVPGIALAGLAFWLSAAGYWSGPAWLSEFLWVALAINYLNLLPLVPLDGGRVMETLVFVHHPRLRFAFAVLCCAALLAAGLLLEDRVLQVVSVMIALGLPSQWRRMQLDQAIVRDASPAVDEHQALVRIFTALQQVRFQTWTFAQRCAAATALLPELMGRRPGTVQTLGGLLVYGSCLVAPVAALLWAQPGLGPALGVLATTARIPADDVLPDPPPSAASAPIDWSERLASLSTLAPEAQLDIYLGAAQQANDAEDSDAALRHYQSAWALAQGLAARDLRRIDALQGLASLAEDDGQRRAYLHQIVTALEQPLGQERLRVAAAKEQLSYGEVSPAERVGLLRQALQLRQVALGTDDAIATTRLLLARSLDDNADSAEAEAQLRARVAELAPPGGEDRSRQALHQRVRRVLAQVDLAWFLIAHARMADAQQTAREALQTVPPKVTASWLHPQQQALEALVWTQLLVPAKDTLATDWDAYDTAKRSGLGGSRKHLVHEADRALVAQALRDSRLQAQARAGVEESLAPVRHRPLSLCQTRSGTASDWRQTQWNARQRILSELGACPAAAPDPA